MYVKNEDVSCELKELCAQKNSFDEIFFIGSDSELI